MTVARTRIAPRPKTANAEAESRLVAERVAAAGRAESLRRDVEAIVESAKGGATDDEHDVEGATVAFERAQAMALLDETRAGDRDARPGAGPGRRWHLRALRVLRRADRPRAPRGPPGGRHVYPVRVAPALTIRHIGSVACPVVSRRTTERS